MHLTTVLRRLFKPFVTLAILSLPVWLTLSFVPSEPSPCVQALLLQMAARAPEGVIGVIVQKTVADDRVERLVEARGGVITRDLAIINAFSADLKAKEVPALARAAGVRWVSFDAPVQQSDAAPEFVSWATSLGNVVPQGFTNAANMADNDFGPNRTFGYGSKVKGAFSGFSAEITPGTKIAKVEVALRVYTSATLTGSDDPHVMVYVGGKQVKNYGIKHQLFAPYVGAPNAGTLYVDITPGYAWKWGNFDSGIQVAIDQTKFNSGHVIYYDAVGLRITTALGDDPTGGTGPTSMPKAPINTSNLVTNYDWIVRAPNVWNEGPNYYQGQGLTVAVVDSGILRNNDLGKRLIGGANFNASYHTSLDLYGHGTFVASVIAGDGTQSKGQYIGIAPKTNIVNVRISDDQGMATEADTVAGLQWVLNNKAKYNIRVVNLSLNASVAESYHTNPLDAAVEILWFNKIVVVASAGNLGVATLYPPANDPFVITTGATNDLNTRTTTDDLVAPFSSYGLTEIQTPKPELVAPGTDIIAYLPSNGKTTIGTRHPANAVNVHYFRMSGTSLSAPIVSGAAVLLLQAQPTLNPDQVKYRLMATADKNWAGYSASKAGAGYVDVYAALHGTTTGSANANYRISKLLFTGAGSVNWNNVNWDNVNWNNVNWNNVNWNNVNWNNVNWNSDYWGQ